MGLTDIESALAMTFVSSPQGTSYCGMRNVAARPGALMPQAIQV